MTSQIELLIYAKLTPALQWPTWWGPSGRVNYCGEIAHTALPGGDQR